MEQPCLMCNDLFCECQENSCLNRHSVASSQSSCAKLTCHLLPHVPQLRDGGCWLQVVLHPNWSGAVGLKLLITDHADSNWVSGEGWPMQPWIRTCCEAMPHGHCGTGQTFSVQEWKTREQLWDD